MRSERLQSVGRGVLLLSVCMAAGPAGCQKLAAVVANMSGGDWIDPEFELTQQPLLILIDDPAGLVTEPRAVRELHATLAANFLEFKVNQNVVPFAELVRLQQSEPDIDRLPIRRVGEKLGAEQVLYLRVERFTLNAEPGAPIFKGEFAVRVKVLTTDRRHDPRLWPDDEAGKRVAVSTQPAPMDGEKTPGDVATELGIKLGQAVARLFYGHRQLDSPGSSWTQ